MSGKKTRLVDTQDVFNVLSDYYHHSTHVQHLALQEALNKVPTADTEPHWIPCSERLPEEREWIGTKEFGTTISDEVYVTFEGPTGERFCKHLSFQNGKLSPHTQREIDVWYKGSIPIAWMPLPEPYEVKE